MADPSDDYDNGLLRRAVFMHDWREGAIVTGGPLEGLNRDQQARGLRLVVAWWRAGLKSQNQEVLRACQEMFEALGGVARCPCGGRLLSGDDPERCYFCDGTGQLPRDGFPWSD